MMGQWANAKLNPASLHPLLSVYPTVPRTTYSR